MLLFCLFALNPLSAQTEMKEGMELKKEGREMKKEGMELKKEGMELKKEGMGGSGY